MSHTEHIKKFSTTLQTIKSDDYMKLVDELIGDDGVESLVAHIEDFYGIEDDEELGHLAQIIVTGYLMGLKYTSE